MIPVFGLLHYNGREMTRRCIESIEQPVEHFVLVLNGDHEYEAEVRALIATKSVTRISIIKLENAGWAVAVNLILTAYPTPWMEWTFNGTTEIPISPARLSQSQSSK